MRHLDAFSNKDLQNLNTLLGVVIQDGVTDTRILKVQSQQLIDSRHEEAMRGHEEASKSKDALLKKCPCGNGVLVGPYKLEGLVIKRCSVKCGYSEVVK